MDLLTSIHSEELFNRFLETDNSQNLLLRNAVMSGGIEKLAFNTGIKADFRNHFNVEIKTGKITSQEKSGRCWMFAGLNLFRNQVAEALNTEDFEFSQNYLMFYDKLEKANYFLESILETAGEDVYSRLVMWLLHDPLQDGGQWEMFANLIRKYGSVPKQFMPETFHSNNSAIMNSLLTSRLRFWASELRHKLAVGKPMDEVRKLKNDYLCEFYRHLCTFLGTPPTKFYFEYKDKAGKNIRSEELSPITFVSKYLKINPDEYVSLIHAPTADKKFNQSYSIQYLGNVWEGKKVLYLNCDLPVLKSAAISQLKAGESVWFGCDIRIQTEKQKGLMDPEIYLYNHVLGIGDSADKSRRLTFGDSLLTHAMVLTGVHLLNEQPVRWKVENSWGEDRGEKGFFIMSDKWFDEYTYQVVIHRKYLADDMLELLDKEPVVLPPWDPMGSLARMI